MDTKGQVGCGVSFGGIKLAWYHKKKMGFKKIAIFCRMGIVLENKVCTSKFKVSKRCLMKEKSGNVS